MAIDASTAFVTVRFVDPEIDPEVAVIIAVPTARPLANPAVVMLAVVFATALQVTDAVRSCVELSVKVPVAVNCSVTPMGTDGFEFVEYTGPDPHALAALFERMGFVAAARHRSKNVTLYKQGEVNFILNAEPGSFAQAFARLHGPSVCAMALTVDDLPAALDRALLYHCQPYAGGVGPNESVIPAVCAPDGSLIYFVEAGAAPRNRALRASH